MAPPYIAVALCDLLLFVTSNRTFFRDHISMAVSMYSQKFSQSVMGVTVSQVHSGRGRND
jgi:hypothetical protein